MKKRMVREVKECEVINKSESLWQDNTLDEFHACLPCRCLVAWNCMCQELFFVMSVASFFGR